MNDAYIWGAGKWGAAAYEYCKDKFNITAFADKRAGSDLQVLKNKKVISPEELFYMLNLESCNPEIIIAVKYPMQVIEKIISAVKHANIYIFNGSNPDSPLLYKYENGLLCVPEYMDKIYNESDVYKAHYNDLPDLQKNRLMLALNIIKDMGTNCRICELGCGSGQFANLLYDNGFTNYDGVDFSGTAIDIAKRSNPDLAENFYKADIFEWLKSKKQSSDTLYVIFEVLEHIKDDAELLNSLPQGCSILLSVPSFMSFDHLRTFNCEEDILKRYPMIRKISYTVIPASDIYEKDVWHIMLAKKGKT